MSVEEVEGEGGVFRAAASKNLDVVVANTVDCRGTCAGEGVRKSFDKGHLGGAWE